MDIPVSFYEYDIGISLLGPNSSVRLEVGAPGPRELKNILSYMKEAFMHRLETIDRRAAQSAQYGRNEGDPFLIDELHKFLSENYRNPVAREDLFITNGASAGVWDVLSWFFREGDTVYIEDPTYKAILPALQSSNFKVVGISTDKDGMLVDELEMQLQSLESKEISTRYPFRAAVYVIPVCHNPTTRTMSEDRQKTLLNLARKHNLLIVADDVYNLLCYADSETDDPTLAKPPRTLYSHDCKTDPEYEGNVISVGSFSKLIGPGFRLGWYEMPQKLQENFCRSYVIDSGAGKNPLLGGLLAAAFELGLFKKHVNEVKTLYATRMRAVHDIVTKSLGEHGVQCQLPNAGYFLWIVLPEFVSAQEVLELSKEEVSAILGYKCSPSGSYRNCLRISITFYEAEVLYPAVQKLCDFIVLAVTKSKGNV